MWLPPVLAVLAMGLAATGRLPSQPFWDVAWTTAGVSALLGTLAARRAAAPANRERWTLWSAAAGCWLFGQLAWDLFGIIGFPSSPSLADVAWWGFALLVILSMLRHRASSRRVRIVAVIETLPMIGAAVALVLAGLWHDATASTLSLGAQLSVLAYPALYVSAAVLMAQAMIGGALAGSRSRALPVTLGGMVAQAIAFGLWSVQLLDGTYVPGTSALDPLWVFGLLAIGAGGHLAARAPEAVSELDEPASRGGVLPALLFGVLSVNICVVAVQDGPTGALLTLSAGLLLSGGALILRSFLLERRLRDLLDYERANLLGLADREQQMARVNRQLR